MCEADAAWACTQPGTQIAIGYALMVRDANGDGHIDVLEARDAANLGGDAPLMAFVWSGSAYQRVEIAPNGYADQLVSGGAAYSLTNEPDGGGSVLSPMSAGQVFQLIL